MKKLLSLFVLLLLNLTVKPQTPSPDEFLGYSLGSRFTPHQKVVDYFKKVDTLPNITTERVVIQ